MVEYCTEDHKVSDSVTRENTYKRKKINIKMKEFSLTFALVKFAKPKTLKYSLSDQWLENFSERFLQVFLDEDCLM